MMRGFTLPEVLLVIGIFVILFSFVAPIGLNFYNGQQLEAATQEIIQNLRRAQSQSVSVKLDSSFGIHFENENYFLFKGDSYLNRDVQYNEVFNLSKVIKTGGLTEIVFLKLEGAPKPIPAYCGGICAPCGQFVNKNSCQAQLGCSWNRLLRSCLGTCNSCGNFTIQSPCVMQSGCSWYPETKGGDIIINVGNKQNVININEIGRINLR